MTLSATGPEGTDAEVGPLDSRLVLRRMLPPLAFVLLAVAFGVEPSDPQMAWAVPRVAIPVLSLLVLAWGLTFHRHAALAPLVAISAFLLAAGWLMTDVYVPAPRSDLPIFALAVAMLGAHFWLRTRYLIPILVVAVVGAVTILLGVRGFSADLVGRRLGFLVLTAVMVGGYSMVRDRTMRELRSHRRRARDRDVLLSSVLEAAPVLVWSADSGGRLLMLRGRGVVGPAAMSTDRWIGKPLDRLFDEPGVVDALLKKALLGGAASARAEANGRFFEIHAQGAPAVTGRAPRVSGVIVDVTASVNSERVLEEAVAARTAELEAALIAGQREADQRREVEVRLTEAEVTLASLLANFEGMAYRRRMIDGWPHTLASDGCLALVGAEPEALAEGGAVAFRSLIAEADVDAAEETIRHAARSGVTFQVRYRIRALGGQERWVLDQGRMVDGDPDGEVIVEGVITDVTAQEISESRLRQTQKLEAIGQLAGGIAHDFNNVMTVVTSYGSLLQEALPSDHPGRADVGHILDAAERASRLTRQLLTFSRKQHVRPDRLDINAVILGLADMLRTLVTERVRLVLELADGQAPVIADLGQLEQVLVNLAVNARDAMPDGGTLRLATSVVAEAADSGPERRWVEILVRDTGCGMSEEVLARIYEPFFTTKEPGQGTGLGLATIYAAVRQNNGRIEVESEVGEGTVFRIRFPWVQTMVDQSSSPVPAPQPESHGRILIVEDDRAVRRLMNRILTRAGHRVLVAEAVEEALILIKSGEELDLLISDVVMPGADGTELVSEVRTLRPDLPVLFVSGYTDFRAESGGEVLAQSEFLEKPFSSSSLRSKVAEMLNQET